MRIEYKPEGTETKEEVTEHALSQGQTVMEEMKLQRQKMKDKPFKEKLGYYVNYYKWYVIGGAAVLGILISVIYTMVTRKDMCFSSMIINASNLYETTISTDFGSYASLDLDKYECFIDTTCSIGTTGGYYEDTATVAKMVANIQGQDLDCVVCDSVRFETDSLNGTYQDITKLLSADMKAKFADKFYYIDMEEVRKNEEAELTGDTSNLPINQYETSVDEMRKALEYHLHPENMKEPIAVGIIIDDAPFIVNNNAYPFLIPVFGVVANTTRPELAVRFLEFLYL